MTGLEQRSVAAPWDAARVSAFDDGPDEVLVIERPDVLGLATSVRAARVFDWRATVTAPRAGVRVRDALAALTIESEPLAADIAGVARGFLAQFGLERAALRVEVADAISCPKFHCDNVRVRLIVTYHGPGTEVAPADRPGDVSRVPTGAFVFLKGHKHPAYADRTLHRSPEVPPGEKRLCVVLDL